MASAFSPITNGLCQAAYVLSQNSDGSISSSSKHQDLKTIAGSSTASTVTVSTCRQRRIKDGYSIIPEDNHPGENLKVE
jgi:hypothetical protein